jgi:two-component system NtrC family sensor kinase
MAMEDLVSRDERASQTDNFAALSQSILRSANRGAARIEFLTEISGMLLEFLQLDAVELRLQDRDLSYRWEFALRPARLSRFTVLDDAMECDAAFRHYPSVALLPFTVDERSAGQLLLKSLQESRFGERNEEFYWGVAGTIGLAVASRQAQWALRERVKELTCLYGIGRIAQLPGVSLGDAIQQIAELLPPAWQFPDIACARIILDGRVFATSGYQEGSYRQTAELTIDGKERGLIEVAYLKEREEFAEGPFLPEERSLIDTVAREVGLVVGRRETEESQATLQAQLRHADRLATIGQLAAGVAHELNEPLGSILGFAQLMQKAPDLPQAAAKDLEKIVKASLHAREVIHKLLVFSRQKPPVKVRVNLNRVVSDGLYFLESRCARAGITLCPVLAPDLPEIPADASQLHQVVVNLVVNSIQAMPDGGTLTIETHTGTDWVSLSVQDTGAGMTNEVREKMFTPFFTTKDVDQGTGLGLAVVHGIVTSHGGSVHVESAPEKGARFEIRLPRNGHRQDETAL